MCMCMYTYVFICTCECRSLSTYHHTAGLTSDAALPSPRLAEDVLVAEALKALEVLATLGEPGKSYARPEVHKSGPDKGFL